MRALVTGASGFVGRHLVERLHAGGTQVAAPDIDVTDIDTLHAALDLAQPEVVFHLAAQSFVPRALEAPGETYAVNIIGTANLLAAVRAWRDREARAVRLLFVSSADVYGAQPETCMPIDESCAPNPANPYAASKAAAEAIVLGEVRSFGLDAVITRAFNHIGPGQSEQFVVPSLAAQLVAIARGARPLLLVGNLEPKRDFLDVRDVVDAYVTLAREGRAGEIYNVCSGNAVSIREILGELIRIAHVPVEVRNDPARMRPADAPISHGSNEKLRHTGWEPQIPLARSLQDVYACFDKLRPSTVNSDCRQAQDDKK